jgi:hypothetical protein
MKWQGVDVRVNGEAWPFDPRMHLELAFTTYKRGGKYSAGDHCIPWSAIPKGASTESPGPIAEVENPALLEERTGWWPVVCVSQGPLAPTSTRPTSTIVKTVYMISSRVVTVSVYQWMWDQPVGWYISITRARSRL